MALKELKTLTVPYKEKEQGNIIDPGEWNNNFEIIEKSFNDNVAAINENMLPVEALADIKGISQEIKGREDYLPSEAAVQKAMKKASMGDMLMSDYDKDGDGIVDNSSAVGGYTADKLLKQGEAVTGLSFNNITIQVSEFVYDANNSAYPYVASIPLDGVTKDSAGYVIFSGELLNLADPSPETYDGGLKIFVSALPNNKTIITNFTAFNTITTSAFPDEPDEVINYPQLYNFLRIYSNGKEDTEITGGLIEGATTGGTTTRNEDEINYVGTGTYATLIPTNTINMTEYVLGEIIYEVNSFAEMPAINVKYGANSDGDTDATLLISEMIAETGKNELKIDVSALAESTYLSVQPNATATETTSLDIDVQNILFFKSDDFATLCSLAGIEAPTNLAALLTNASILRTIFANEDCCKFMVRQCTGDFMHGMLNSPLCITLFLNTMAHKYAVQNEVWTEFMNLYGVTTEIIW